jgi:hypothetical protein
MNHPAPASPASAVPGPSNDERLTATVSFLGILFMPVLLPIVLYASNPTKPFARAAAAQAAAIQAAFYGSAMVLPFLFVLGPMLVILLTDDGNLAFWGAAAPVALFGGFFLVCVALSIYAAVRAHQGVVVRAPLVGGWVARFTRTG